MKQLKFVEKWTVYEFLELNEEKTRYRRIGGSWEQLMGESWEPCYHQSEDELEAAFALIAPSLEAV